MAHVIIGAGLAGAKAAEKLRAEGYDGELVLVGDERERPYERPPLSKGYLIGDQDRGEVFVHDEGWYGEHGVDLRLGTRAVRIDRGAREVELGDGARLGYSKLLLATGSSPRRLKVEGNTLDGVHYVRRLGHTAALREALGEVSRVVVAGAGWIGLEIAAAARGKGCEVTVVDPAPSPLHAALGQEMGGFFADIHRDHGVQFRFGEGVERFAGAGRVEAVVTPSGEIPADLVVVGVGARPNVELAEDAGLAVDGGVVVDQAMRTEDPDIFAAGDIAAVPSSRYGRRLRVEHWQNAISGGEAAAVAMLGGDVVYDDLPYFFSDQYDVGMEFVGLVDGYDRVETRGDVAGRAFTAYWVAGEEVVAGMHVNLWDDGIDAIRDLVAGRGLPS
jgi:3-phenylpropionate/trans-cinnamate dioxygenase ferredoxin reductase subunit